MIIPMDENEDFQHLEEMIVDLLAKQKQILKGMLDYPIQIDSAIRILSDPSRQLATTAHNIAFLVSKRYIIDVEKFNQQRFKCATQM